MKIISLRWPRPACAYRLTESNDYLGGVPGASDAFASALWALDHLHWWAAHGAAGVNFHNRRGLAHRHDRARSGRRRGYVINPKGYGIKAFTLGSAGQVKPAQIRNPDGINLTAYCVGAAGQDYVTVINKAHGAGAGDAVVTIVPPGPRLQGAQVMTLAGGQPGDARGATATLGGATITGDSTWDGKWSHPARRSARGNQPDRQGHHRRHRQDPERRLMHPRQCCAEPSEGWTTAMTRAGSR